MFPNPATPQAFLSGMEETAEVLCVLLLFFLTSCAQYFCLSLLLRHSKQHHKANDKKTTKSFHAVQLPPPLPGTLMGNFLLRLTKLNKNCMDSSVMIIYSTTHPRRHFCTYTDIFRLTAALGRGGGGGDRCLGLWEPDTHRC